MIEKDLKSMRKGSTKNGFTVCQLLVSIVVVVIFGALWGAYNQQEQIKKQQQSSLIESKKG